MKTLDFPNNSLKIHWNLSPRVTPPSLSQIEISAAGKYSGILLRRIYFKMNMAGGQISEHSETIANEK